MASGRLNSFKFPRNFLNPPLPSSAAAITDPFFSYNPPLPQYDSPPPYYHGQRHGLHKARLCRFAARQSSKQPPAITHPLQATPSPPSLSPLASPLTTVSAQHRRALSPLKKVLVPALVHKCVCLMPFPSTILQVASMTSTFSSGTKHCKRLRTTATSDVHYRSTRSSSNLFYLGIPFSTARLRIGTLWSAIGREAYSSARSPPFIRILHILTLVEGTCGVSLKSTTSCSLNPPSTHPRTAKLPPKSCLRRSAWPGSTSACRPF